MFVNYFRVLVPEKRGKILLQQTNSFIPQLFNTTTTPNMFSSTTQRELWLPRSLSGCAVKLNIPKEWRDEQGGSYRVLLRYNKGTCDPISISFKNDKPGDDWKQNSIYFTNPAFAGTKFLDGFREWTVAINQNKKWIPSKSTDYYEGKLPPKPEKPKTPLSQRKSTPKKQGGANKEGESTDPEQKSSAERDDAAKKTADDEAKFKAEEERKAKLLESVNSVVERVKQLENEQISAEEDLLTSSWTAIAKRKGAHLRDELLRLYNGKCAASGSALEILLEVAWIDKSSPVAASADNNNSEKNERNSLTNALLLSTDLHTLFDLYYWTLSDDYVIMLSDALLADNKNERIAALDGNKIHLPEDNSQWPSIDRIQHHRHVALKLRDYTKTQVQSK